MEHFCKLKIVFSLCKYENWLTCKTKKHETWENTHQKHSELIDGIVYCILNVFVLSLQYFLNRNVEQLMILKHSVYLNSLGSEEKSVFYLEVKIVELFQVLVGSGICKKSHVGEYLKTYPRLPYSRSWERSRKFWSNSWKRLFLYFRCNYAFLMFNYHICTNFMSVLPISLMTYHIFCKNIIFYLFMTNY